MTRTVRILGIATLIAFLFRLSRQLSESWGVGQVEGYTVAVGVVALLFSVRAAVTEYTQNDVPIAQKDILWGLSLGAFVTLLVRLVS